MHGSSRTFITYTVVTFFLLRLSTTLQSGRIAYRNLGFYEKVQKHFFFLRKRTKHRILLEGGCSYIYPFFFLLENFSFGLWNYYLPIYLSLSRSLCTAIHENQTESGSFDLDRRNQLRMWHRGIKIWRPGQNWTLQAWIARIGHGAWSHDGVLYVTCSLKWALQNGNTKNIENY